jgi:hypothetical protein
MAEYSFREGDKILQNLIKSEDKNKMYILTPHLKSRANLRKIDIDYIKKMLLTQEPLGVLSSRKNRFKIFYPSENDPYFDLIIVIAIDDDQKIIGVTTYEDIISHREGIK